MKRDAPDHPKSQKLAHLLGIPKATTVGLLELLWHFTARYTPQGDIGKFSDEQIAKEAGWIEVLACGYCKTPDMVTAKTPDMVTAKTPDMVTAKTPDIQQILYFVQALLDCRLLDKSTQYRLVVHDWGDHADDSVKKRLRRNELDFIPEVVRQNGGQSDRQSGGQSDRQSESTVADLPTPTPGPTPTPEPTALTAQQATRPSPTATPPDTPQGVHTPKNNRPVQKSLIPWLRSELHAYVKGATGVCRSWEEPDDDICLKILVATHGADSNSIERWLQILYRSQQYPELNYAWFETMAEKRFGKKASSLERADDNPIISGAAGVV